MPLRDLRLPYCRMMIVVLSLALPGLLTAGCAGPKGAPAEVALPETVPPGGPQAWNPLIASDPDGRVYVTYYAGPGEFERGLYFTRSVDGGATWLPEPIELEPVTPPGTRIGFHKLEKGGKGNVFVTW